MIDETRVYRKCGETVLRRIAGETLLIPIRGRLADMQRIFALDPVAERVWEHVDGKKGMGQIARRIQADFDVEAAVALRDIDAFIASLREEGLVEEVVVQSGDRAGDKV